MAPPVYRALIVDDDEDARALLHRALSKGALAFEITAACDGAEALALVQTVHPDVVITDVMMPKLGWRQGDVAPILRFVRLAS